MLADLDMLVIPRWFVRKMVSAFIRFKSVLRTMSVYFRVFFNRQILIGEGCSFGRSVLLKATEGGSITIGQRASLGDCVQIVAQYGRVVIEDDVHIGSGSIVVCQQDIFIGRDTLIAEYVVIRDQDHNIRTRPIRSAGFITSPIRIGQDVWIGCKATILRGATIGDRCVIGAHALVKSEIPEDMLAVGIPAHAIRCNGPSQ
jgi:acetyltransferase-like isoleucine patch superfamily enzyme